MFSLDVKGTHGGQLLFTATVNAPQASADLVVNFRPTDLEVVSVFSSHAQQQSKYFPKCQRVPVISASDIVLSHKEKSQVHMIPDGY